VLKTLFAK